MSLIQIFIMKLIDNGLFTVKTVYMHKEKYFKVALFNALSTYSTDNKRQ